jgi:hypothetical protein
LHSRKSDFYPQQLGARRCENKVLVTFAFCTRYVPESVERLHSAIVALDGRLVGFGEVELNLSCAFVPLENSRMIVPSFRAAAGTRQIMLTAAGLVAILLTAIRLRSDEPYARTRDYDLQHSKIALRFDLDQKKVLGDVSHTVAILRDGTSKIAFDSVGLTIQSVTVNKSPAKFETIPAKLLVPLPASSHPGEKFEIEIRYEGKPAKGLYFILPDRDYPDRPKQIWT